MANHAGAPGRRPRTVEFSELHLVFVCIRGTRALVAARRLYDERKYKFLRFICYLCSRGRGSQTDARAPRAVQPARGVQVTENKVAPGVVRRSEAVVPPVIAVLPGRLRVLPPAVPVQENVWQQHERGQPPLLPHLAELVRVRPKGRRAVQ